ncbi:MAG: DUF3892 domain-containing protein [bacterium]
MSVRITCVTKDKGNHENPYVAIESLGWIEDGTLKTGNSTRLEMYDWVVNKKGKAYVKDSQGNVAYLIGAISPRGNKYVKTVSDETKTDNLLKLDECQ